MKLLNYLTVLCIAVFAAACNDDDEPKTDEPTKVELSGTYEVNADYYVGKPNEETTPVSVELEVKGDKATLKTPAMGTGSMSVKPMTIEDITVTKVSDNTYSFKKETFDLPMDKIVYKVTVSEKSVITDGKMDFEITVKPGEMPMSFTLSLVSK